MLRGTSRDGMPEARERISHRTLTRSDIEALSPGQRHTLTGNIRLHPAFPSRILGRARDILVYLPPGYDADRHERYPVLYFNDGQNLFDGATAYVPGQEWGLDETAERLIRANDLPPLIIVAINHAGDRRIDEFTPTRDRRRRVGGSAAFYGRMLTDELKPFIDQTYRTKSDAASTGLGGSSMGGLVALHLGFERPDVFGRIAAMSPSIWWGDRAIVARIGAGRDTPSLKIWLDVGLAEGHRAVEDVRATKAALERRGWVLEKNLAYCEAPDAGHNESAWGARAEPMLRFLFGPPPAFTAST